MIVRCRHATTRTLGLMMALFLVLAVLAASHPAGAQITSVSPGSRSVPQGTFAQISVSVTTDQAAVASGGCSGPVTISGGGAGPTAGFTVTVPATTALGSYSCSFTDGTDSASFTVNVVEPPPTTTTSSTTTTTQAPTTTRPPTTTTTRPRRSLPRRPRRSLPRQRQRCLRRRPRRRWCRRGSARRVTRDQVAGPRCHCSSAALAPSLCLLRASSCCRSAGVVLAWLPPPSSLRGIVDENADASNPSARPADPRPVSGCGGAPLDRWRAGVIGARHRTPRRQFVVRSRNASACAATSNEADDRAGAAPILARVTKHPQR